MAAFLEGLGRYAPAPDYPAEFGARIFKIARDGQGNRLTYLKVTGGKLRVKTVLTNRRHKITYRLKPLKDDAAE